MTLEELTPGAAVRGIVPDGVVTVVSVQWYGELALELTYKTATGKVANTLLYRDGDSPMETLLINRILSAWLQVMHADTAYAQMLQRGGTFKEGEYHQKRVDRAQQQLLRAIQALATVRRPSVQALSVGLGERYISKAAGDRIRVLLSSVAGDGASHQDLFRVALTRANAAPASRSEKFNALYAYHRSLLVVVFVGLLLLLASRWWGAARAWSVGGFLSVVIALVATFLLLWHRTRQRAYHFVQETLYVTERTFEVHGPTPVLREE